MAIFWIVRILATLRGWVTSFIPKGAGEEQVPASMGARADDLRDATPSLNVILEQQLGLKLEPHKAQIKTLVIEHIEKNPTEN